MEDSLNLKDQNLDS